MKFFYYMPATLVPRPSSLSLHDTHEQTLVQINSFDVYPTENKTTTTIMTIDYTQTTL